MASSWKKRKNKANKSSTANMLWFHKTFRPCSLPFAFVSCGSCNWTAYIFFRTVSKRKRLASSRTAAWKSGWAPRGPYWNYMEVHNPTSHLSLDCLKLEWLADNRSLRLQPVFQQPPHKPLTHHVAPQMGAEHCMSALSLGHLLIPYTILSTPIYEISLKPVEWWGNI